MFEQDIKDVRVNSLYQEHILWDKFGLNKNDLKSLSNREIKAKLWFCSCIERKREQKRIEMEMRNR